MSKVGLAIVGANRLIDVLIMKCIDEFACLKLLGSGSDGHRDTTAKKLRDNTNSVGGALNDTVNEYRLNIEDEQQDASNVLDVLKESTLHMENRINEKVVKKRAVKFYLSLHVNFHLRTDVAFLTDPQAVLSTDTIEVYVSCDIHDALNSTYKNLVSAIEDFQHRGSGWILDKLVALDSHLLEYYPLRATLNIPLPTYIQNRKALINIKNKDEKCFYGLLLLTLMEIFRNVYLITCSTRRNSTFKVFNFQ